MEARRPPRTARPEHKVLAPDPRAKVRVAFFKASRPKQQGGQTRQRGPRGSFGLLRAPPRPTHNPANRAALRHPAAQDSTNEDPKLPHFVHRHMMSRGPPMNPHRPRRPRMRAARPGRPPRPPAARRRTAARDRRARRRKARRALRGGPRARVSQELFGSRCEGRPPDLHTHVWGRGRKNGIERRASNGGLNWCYSRGVDGPGQVESCAPTSTPLRRAGPATGRRNGLWMEQILEVGSAGCTDSHRNGREPAGRRFRRESVQPI